MNGMPSCPIHLKERRKRFTLRLPGHKTVRPFASATNWSPMGRRVLTIDGLHSWDPQQRVIVFWYVDAKGSLTKGTVKMEDGKLVHQFQETESDGKTADYVARVTPHGNEA